MLNASKKVCSWLAAAVLSVAGVSTLLAEDTRESAAAAPKYDIIASNFGRIGKLGDEDDLRVITKGTKNLEMNKAGTHFEDELPLKTKGGKRIGAIGVVFNYKPGDDKVALDKIATEIQKEMQAQITSSKTLFGPAS